MTRTVLVLACIALVALVLWAMRLGWRNRATRQAHLPALPAVPGNPGAALLRASGVYVGTSFASSWQDRVVHDGLGKRATADATLHVSGLVLHRQGAAAIFIPSRDWVAARLAPALAGKVMGDGGLLVLRWRLGNAELDTGFRADDKATYAEWVRTINEEVTAA
jgi:hypothetical protein